MKGDSFGLDAPGVPTATLRRAAGVASVQSGGIFKLSVGTCQPQV